MSSQAPSVAGTDGRPWHVRFLDTDIVYSFTHSPVAIGAGLLTLLIVLSATFAPLIAPHSPFDLTTFSLIDAEIPPAWMEDGDSRFLLGTDAQGRDQLSLILYGSRISLIVGFLSILFAMTLGVTVGLISGFVGEPWTRC